MVPKGDRKIESMFLYACIYLPECELDDLMAANLSLTSQSSLRREISERREIITRDN